MLSPYLVLFLSLSPSNFISFYIFLSLVISRSISLVLWFSPWFSLAHCRTLSGSLSLWLSLIILGLSDPLSLAGMIPISSSIRLFLWISFSISGFHSPSMAFLLSPSHFNSSSLWFFMVSSIYDSIFIYICFYLLLFVSLFFYLILFGFLSQSQVLSISLLQSAFSDVLCLLLSDFSGFLSPPLSGYCFLCYPSSILLFLVLSTSLVRSISLVILLFCSRSLLIRSLFLWFAFSLSLCMSLSLVLYLFLSFSSSLCFCFSIVILLSLSLSFYGSCSPSLSMVLPLLLYVSHSQFRSLVLTLSLRFLRSLFLCFPLFPFFFGSISLLP